MEKQTNIIYYHIIIFMSTHKPQINISEEKKQLIQLKRILHSLLFFFLIKKKTEIKLKKTKIKLNIG